MKTQPKNPAAVAMGKMKSPAKAASSRENGKLGGAPTKAERERKAKWIKEQSVHLMAPLAAKNITEQPYMKEMLKALKDPKIKKISFKPI